MDINEHGPSMEMYAALLIEGELAGNSDLSPGDLAPLLRIEHGHRVLRLLRWGLVPWWAEDMRIGTRCFNARSETAAETPAFRDAMRYQRGVIVVDAFYEWSGPKSARKKHRIGMTDGGPVHLAALWDRWARGEGETLETCTVLTCEPNQLLAPIHERMPVILAPTQVGRWIDPVIVDRSVLADLLSPLPADAIRVEPVYKQ